MNKCNVILDTDIGGDIDDTWALAMMLNCHELDTRLVVTATADTVYRAKIVAKLLERNHRTDVPVGIGLRFPSDGPREHQLPWVKDYPLEQYPGAVYQDGVQAMIDVVEASPEPVTLIAIAPLTNIAELVRRAPHLTRRINLISMMGSIDYQHRHVPGAIAEFNVVKDIPAAQTVFAAQWNSLAITPLDSCGHVVLNRERYQRVKNSTVPLARDVIENYRIWNGGGTGYDPETASSVLFDTVAVYMAYSTAKLQMKPMKLKVDDEGFTRPDPNGTPVDVAIDWNDFPGYLDELVERLLR